MLDVADADFLKQLMIKDFASFRNRRTVLDEQDAFNANMFQLRDDHWKHVRQVLTPTFTSGKLKQVKVLLIIVHVVMHYCIRNTYMRMYCSGF